MGLIVGFVVSAEVIYLYLTNNVIVDGSINRGMIFTGWGCCNNIGAMISLSIPFAFYFVSRKKHASIFLCIAIFLFGMVVLTTSRGSLLGALYAFGACFIYANLRAYNKKQVRIASLILICVVAAFVLIFHKMLIAKFQQILTIAYIENGSLVILDSGRFDIYKLGLKVFLEYPIFGETFFPTEFPGLTYIHTETFRS